MSTWPGLLHGKPVFQGPRARCKTGRQHAFTGQLPQGPAAGRHPSPVTRRSSAPLSAGEPGLRVPFCDLPADRAGYLRVPGAAQGLALSGSCGAARPETESAGDNCGTAKVTA